MAARKNRTSVVEEERFFVIVPETIFGGEPKPFEMEAGRLIAQGFHLGRVIENLRAKDGMDHKDITTIVLAARNSKEMAKIYHDLGGLQRLQHAAGNPVVSVKVYQDHNKDVYRTDDRILTAIGVGPVTKSTVEPVIGHLDLY